MNEIRKEYLRIRDAAADPESGEAVRAALALRVLRHIYAEAHANGLDTGPLDLVAIVCGFADTTQSLLTAPGAAP